MEQRALGDLQVAVVNRWQRQQVFDLGLRRGDAGIGPEHQLDDLRVALVGHDRYAGGVLRRQRDEAELRAGEQRAVPRAEAQDEEQKTVMEGKSRDKA